MAGEQVLVRRTGHVSRDARIPADWVCRVVDARIGVDHIHVHRRAARLDGAPRGRAELVHVCARQRWRMSTQCAGRAARTWQAQRANFSLTKSIQVHTNFDQLVDYWRLHLLVASGAVVPKLGVTKVILRTWRKICPVQPPGVLRCRRRRAAQS